MAKPMVGQRSSLGLLSSREQSYVRTFPSRSYTRARLSRRCARSAVYVANTIAVTSPSKDLPQVAVKPAVSVSKLLWSSPTGQSGTEHFGAPLRGRPEPLGCTVDGATGHVNFAVFSSNAISVTLVLFWESDLANGRATYEVVLHPIDNKTGDVWHVMIPNINRDLLYGFKVKGLHQDTDPEATGHRFKENTVVLDPYAQAIIGRRQYGVLGPNLNYGGPGVLGLAATWPLAACAMPPHHDNFDWQGDRPLNNPMESSVIYELHVRHFTADPSSGVSNPGTYAGLTEKLDHLASLGVTAVELLPIHEFNELEYYTQIPGSNPPAYRYNAWGYSTVGFFAPMSRYSANIARGGNAQSLAHEFKTLVRECHKRGMEVILDVVFNHTAEGNEKGPTLSFRGLDNRIYYMLAPGGEYYNYSGCGNTLNCNHPTVRQFIVDCLKFWVTEYHVDGFRFDLASILTRAPSAWHPQQYDEEGNKVAMHSAGAAVDANGTMTDGAGVPTGTPLSDPPLVEIISEDPILRNTKMIAEAWDCDGLNQVGAFPHYGGRWAEWNGRFRDTVRNFIKGSDGWAGPFAAAMCGSPDLYANNTPQETDWWASNAGRKWKGGRNPSASINFVAAHDGFTLADLVAYNDKHNEANGESNRDGENHNSSWNCGVEGPTDNWKVKRLRQRQMRNMSLALMMAHGIPMITMGDEYGHSKNGNNNTYCHDSPLNWFNWTQAQADETGFARFSRHLINFRRAHTVLQRTSYVGERDVQWHGDKPNVPDWTEQSRMVAYTMPDGKGGGLFVAFNTSHVSRVVELPSWGSKVWQPVIDTSKLAPYDFLVADNVLSQEEVDKARAAATMWIADLQYPMLPWSAIVLQSVPDTTTHHIKAASVKQGHHVK